MPSVSSRRKLLVAVSSLAVVASFAFAGSAAAGQIDTTAPDAPGSFTAEDALVSNPVSTTVDFTLSEEGGTVECRFNDGDWGACTSVVGTAGKFTVTDLTGGEQSIAVRQTDEASNTSNVGSVYLAPKLIDAPVGLLTKSGPEFKAAHASSGVLWCKFETANFNSGSFDPCFDEPGPSYLSASHLSVARGVPADGVTTDTFTACSPDCAADGSYAVSYKQVIDGKSSLVSKATWVQDTTGPRMSDLTGRPASITNSGSASVSFTSEEENVTFECSVDSGAYAACTSPKVLNDLPDGEHRLDVRAVDAIGNHGDSVFATWTVDATAPAAPTVTSPANSSFSGTTVPFTASGEQGARFVCSLDGGAFTNCPSSNASPGDKGTITVGWNTKLHWGESPGWASLALGVDVPNDGPSWAPAFLPASSFPDGVTFLTFFAALGYGSYAPSCEVAAQLLEQQKTLFVFGVTNGDSPPTTYNSFALDCSSTLAEVGAGGPAQFKSLSNGQHTLTVKQVDRAGNESSAITRTWTVGTAPHPGPVLSKAPVLSKVGLKFNFKTRVTTLLLNAAADTRVPGNSVKWVEYFSHEKRPAANAVQHPAKIRQYATTVTLRAGEVAFWVRVKDTKGKWSGWYSTRK